MALKEISELAQLLTLTDNSWVHVKEGATDFKIRPQVLFDLYNLRSGSATNLTLTSSDVGLGNVTNDSQLKVSSNLADVASASASRTNLSIDSSTEVDAKVDAHGNLTNNPHSTTKAQVGLASVPNFPATSTITDASVSKFATINAVKQVNDKVVALAESFVPTLGVIMWPTTNAIPAGWIIMDGTNGTIDMRGQFVRGGDFAPGATQVGTTGGQDHNAHSHTATIAGTALTESQGAVHSHALGHQVTGSHLYGGSGGAGTGPAAFNNPVASNQAEDSAGGDTHTHTIGINNSSTVSQSNLPPYYTMIFIQKT